MPDDVFALIERLATLIPFGSDAVSRSVGVTLEKSEGGSNPYFTTYKGSAADGGALVRSVELRVRDRPERGRDGLLIVDVAPSDCVRQRDAMTRYGSPTNVRPPSPHGPSGVPTYLEFKQPWGTLSLGFARQEPGCLTRAVLDATGS